MDGKQEGVGKGIFRPCFFVILFNTVYGGHNMTQRI